MRTLNKGILIAIEGIDGSGKSTLAKSLYDQLVAQQLPAILTKEPGGTALGKQLRTLVQEKTVAMCPEAEFLLFAADRAQHFKELIIPALEQKKIIISDRLSDSSLVYQGYGRGLDHEIIEKINAWAMEDIKPDITFYIQIPLQIAIDRLAKRRESLTAFEKEGTAFTQKLIDGFEKLYKNKPDVIKLDGKVSVQEITAHAMQALLNWI